MSVPRVLDRLPTGSRTSALALRLHPRGGGLELVGVLDRSTVHAFHDAVSTLLAAGQARWRIGTEELVHCDRAGLRAIGVAYRRALAHDQRMVVTGAPPWLRRALERIRLDRHVIEDVPCPGTSAPPAPRVSEET